VLNGLWFLGFFVFCRVEVLFQGGFFAGRRIDDLDLRFVDAQLVQLLEELLGDAGLHLKSYCG